MRMRVRAGQISFGNTPPAHGRGWSQKELCEINRIRVACGNRFRIELAFGESDEGAEMAYPQRAKTKQPRCISQQFDNGVLSRSTRSEGGPCPRKRVAYRIAEFFGGAAIPLCCELMTSDGPAPISSACLARTARMALVPENAPS
jgi:hypothetical protein